MPGSSHLAVLCRAGSTVKESFSDRFKFFLYFGRIITTFSQKEKKKKDRSSQAKDFLLL